MSTHESHRPDARGIPMVHPPDEAAVAAERAWLASVAGRPWVSRQFAYLRRGGPGYLQSALTLGGGTASACLLSGAAFGYELLWVAPLGMILGGIVFMAISHQTLSTGMRPFEAMRVHAGPVFAWGWAIGTVLASVVWHFAQYSLASAVLVDLAEVAGFAAPRWLMGVLVLAWAVPTALGFGSGKRFASGFDRLMRWMVWLIVALFGLVAVRIVFGGHGEGMAGEIARGFVPQVPEDRGEVRAGSVIIAGLATAVGINMTFLYPYTLLARGWGREHREYAKSDVAYGMVLPYIFVTTLMVIVAGATLSADFTGKSIGPVDAAKSLGSLLGPVWGRVLFDLGLLGMLLTTITLHMVCSGLACAEMFRLRVGSPAYRLATLLPTPGVLGSVFWGSISVWLAVPTSIVAGAMLPLAYIGFIRLQTSRAYLGDDRLRGALATAWLVAMGVGTAVLVGFLALTAVRDLPGYWARAAALFGGGA
ncbi:MAG: divalent metal cation transporter [Planctomycetota bacterium]